MIETQFFILSSEQFDQFNIDAQEEGVSIDYFLMEFCDVVGEKVSSY